MQDPSDDPQPQISWSSRSDWVDILVLFTVHHPRRKQATRLFAKEKLFWPPSPDRSRQRARASAAGSGNGERAAWRICGNQPDGTQSPNRMPRNWAGWRMRCGKAPGTTVSGTDLWTLLRLATVIERATAGSLPSGACVEGLGQINWAVQKPARQTREQIRRESCV